MKDISTEAVSQNRALNALGLCLLLRDWLCLAICFEILSFAPSITMYLISFNTYEAGLAR